MPTAESWQDSTTHAITRRARGMASASHVLKAKLFIQSGMASVSDRFSEGVACHSRLPCCWG